MASTPQLLHQQQEIAASSAEIVQETPAPHLLTKQLNQLKSNYVSAAGTTAVKCNNNRQMSNNEEERNPMLPSSSKRYVRNNNGRGRGSGGAGVGVGVGASRRSPSDLNSSLKNNPSSKVNKYIFFNLFKVHSFHNF